MSISKSIAFAFLFSSFNVAVACVQPPPGLGYTHDELISNTQTIILVEPVSAELEFRVIEVLKGDTAEFVTWQVSGQNRGSHIPDDFDAHSDPAFWAEGDEFVVRSQFQGGMCTPAFTFVRNEQYLLFVESRRHPHSAEIINSPDDRWYLYVKERLAHNQSNKPQPSAAGTH